MSIEWRLDFDRFAHLPHLIMSELQAHVSAPIALANVKSMSQILWTDVKGVKLSWECSSHRNSGRVTTLPI